VSARHGTLNGGSPRAAAVTGGAGVSIVYITHRPNPVFAWFVDSLAAQAEPDAALEVIFVDGLHDSGRSSALEELVAGRFGFRHVPAKPNPWNGPHRLTRAQYSAPASARNTGIVYASKPYVVFVDDLCVLAEGWWRQVKEAARERLVVGGAYQKRHEMVVRGGKLLSSRLEPGGLDCRWERGDDDACVAIGGGELFGAGIGAPRDLLVALNGFDELCDPIGGEDYHLGLRIEWAGVPVHYCRAMLAIESEEHHEQPAVVERRDTVLDDGVYMRRLREFGVRHRSTSGPYDGGHLLLDIQLGTRSLTTMGNYYDLGTLAETDLVGTIERFPRNHWLDQRPLAAF
jgi:GT2 family glycosyltransferase